MLRLFFIVEYGIVNFLCVMHVVEVQASSSSTRLLLCQIQFSLHCWATPWRKIMYSISHSPSLFDAPGTAFQNKHGRLGWQLQLQLQLYGHTAISMVHVGRENGWPSQTVDRASLQPWGHQRWSDVRPCTHQTHWRAVTWAREELSPSETAWHQQHWPEGHPYLHHRHLTTHNDSTIN